MRMPAQCARSHRDGTRAAPAKFHGYIGRGKRAKRCYHDKSTTWECTSPRITPLARCIYRTASPRARLCVFTLAQQVRDLVSPLHYRRPPPPKLRIHPARRLYSSGCGSREHSFVFSLQGATSRGGCNYKFRGETESCRIPHSCRSLYPLLYCTVQ